MFHKHTAYKDKEISFLRDFFFRQIQMDFHFLGKKKKMCPETVQIMLSTAVDSCFAFVTEERSEMLKDPGRKTENN